MLLPCSSLLALSAAFGQEKDRRIGSIDFFGYAGMNLDQIRSALPIHKGELYPGPATTIEKIEQAIRSAIGLMPTDVASVCCDRDGNYMIFVGLPGESIRQTRFNPVPKGKAQLPGEILTLYEQTMDALSTAVSKGNAQEDTSKGYALSITDAPLRTKQLAVRAYAIRHESLIRAVLSSSSKTQQRVVAAYLLGYARQSRQQIADLVRASHDPDDGVRNNATRALGVLADSSAKVAAQIPAGGFIRMLSSGSWTDRNKAMWVITTLTKSRDPKLLGELRSEALVSLIEMARWQSTGHAYDARILLGRIAGIEEKRLEQLAKENGVDEIISALPRF